MNPLGNGKQPPMSPVAAHVAEAVRFARTFSSPEEYMRHLQQNNPQMFHKIVNMQKTIQDPVGYANRILAEQGINPAQIAGMLQQK